MRVGELGLVAFDYRTRFSELLAHRIKRLREHSEFVTAGNGFALTEVALGDRACALGKKTQRRGQSFAQNKGQRKRGQEREQQRERKRKPIQIAQALPRQQQFLVFALAGLHNFRVERELLRHRL